MDSEHLLGCQVYNTRSYVSSECSSAGLPLTPCSIRVHGRFQYLSTLRHPRLNRYMSCARSGNESVLFVLEHGPSWLKPGELMETSDVLKYSYQILQGLTYLHNNNIVHHCLDWNALNLNSAGDIQLINYVIYYASLGGLLITSPIDIPRFMPPEKIMSPVMAHESPIPESDDDFVWEKPAYDVWYFGLLLLEMACNAQLWEFLSLKQVFSKLIILFDGEKGDEALLAELLKANKLEETFRNLDTVVQNVIKGCLKIDPSQRMICRDLMALYPESLRLKYSLVSKLTNKHVELFQNFKDPFIEFSKLPLRKLTPESFIFTRPCDEIFHLWTLAGGVLSKEMQRQGLLKLIFKICRFPNCISRDGLYLGNDLSRITKANNKVVPLPIDNLQSKLSMLSLDAFFPLLCFKNNSSKLGPESESSMRMLASNIKEVDVEYQLERVVLFHRILRGFPATRELLIKEASTDIPPHYRGYTWAALLHLNCASNYTASIYSMLDHIDFSTSLPSDKQIEVDIPRCHQYHTLLSSPSAHSVLRTVIRAWVISNPDLVYWQGLDSLAAPFVCLHFNSPALAFSCLSQFIKKFLFKFFLSDNSAIIQEYLSCFSQIIAFHDPELFYHLHEQNFSPNLYAMPWFLTMFAHTFPISKIYHLWDTLILQTASFPLFIGAAILKLLRSHLLSVDFDGAILLFSDIPEIEIESIKSTSLQLFMSTPPSCAFRNWVNPDLYSTQFFPLEDDALMHFSDWTDYDLSDRQLDWCPRIHPRDVVALLTLKAEDGKHKMFSKFVWKLSKFVIFDVRTKSEFDKGHLVDSVNVSIADFALDEEDKLQVAVSEHVSPDSDTLIIVVGPSNNVSPCRTFTTFLVKQSFARVCFVHGGADAFASTDLLIVD